MTSTAPMSASTEFGGWRWRPLGSDERPRAARHPDRHRVHHGARREHLALAVTPRSAAPQPCGTRADPSRDREDSRLDAPLAGAECMIFGVCGADSGAWPYL